MNSLLQALLSPWEWRFEILIPLMTLGVLYTLGWRRLRNGRRSAKVATRGRLTAYWVGLLVLTAALMSPIDQLGGQLFFMHMIQHMLTIMVAAPLLWLAYPFPFLMWGLPRSWRVRTTSLFGRDAHFRRLLAGATRPGVAWLLFIVIYLGWHDPSAYNAALRVGWIHDLEHLTFFAAAMLLWWHVIGAAPRVHGRFPDWGRMALPIAVVPFNMLAGVAIAFAAQPIYTYYESVPRIWGFTVLQDQMLGGIIMWIPGSMMFILASLLLVSGLMRKAESADSPYRPNWDSDDAMVAPGLEHRVVQKRWQDLNATNVSISKAP